MRPVHRRGGRSAAGGRASLPASTYSKCVVEAWHEALRCQPCGSARWRAGSGGAGWRRGASAGRLAHPRAPARREPSLERACSRRAVPRTTGRRAGRRSRNTSRPFSWRPSGLKNPRSLSAGRAHPPGASRARATAWSVAPSARDHDEATCAAGGGGRAAVAVAEAPSRSRAGCRAPAGSRCAWGAGGRMYDAARTSSDSPGRCSRRSCQSPPGMSASRLGARAHRHDHRDVVAAQVGHDAVRRRRAACSRRRTRPAGARAASARGG